MVQAIDSLHFEIGSRPPEQKEVPYADIIGLTFRGSWCLD